MFLILMLLFLTRCRYAEILQENRGFTAEEEDLFDRGAKRAYQEFRDKAAESRGFTPEQMEEFAQVISPCRVSNTSSAHKGYPQD